MFLLQIVLPMIAPLQMLDGLRDLFGVQVHRSVTPSPESTNVPTITEAASESDGIPVATPVTICGAMALAHALLSARVSIASLPLPFASPRARRSVLRV